jgi:hypothetical protein
MDQPTTLNEYASPRRLFVLTTITIFILEAFIMLLLYIMPPLPAVIEGVFDIRIQSDRNTPGDHLATNFHAPF